MMVHPTLWKLKKKGFNFYQCFGWDLFPDNGIGVVKQSKHGNQKKLIYKYKWAKQYSVIGMMCVTLALKIYLFPVANDMRNFVVVESVKF